jgi:hypothetical protein
MNIIYKNSQRILTKNYTNQYENNQVDISDGSIVEYTAYYYPKVNTISEYAKVETKFIGKVECEKSRFSEIIGIYIAPLYIWSHIDYEWKTIINYTYPTYGIKYFVYPHLLLLPGKKSSKNPLYFLETVRTANLSDFSHIENTFTL